MCIVCHYTNVFHYTVSQLLPYNPDNSHDLRSINVRIVGSDKELRLATTMLPAIEKALSLDKLDAFTAKTSLARDATVGKQG